MGHDGPEAAVGSGGLRATDQKVWKSGFGTGTANFGLLSKALNPLDQIMVDHIL